MKTQLDIEEENFMRSTEKLEKNLVKNTQSGNLSDIKGASQVLQYFKDGLADELNYATKKVTKGKAAPSRIANQLIYVMGAEVIAHYAVNTVIDNRGIRQKFGTTVGELSIKLQREFRLHAAKKEDKTGFKYMINMLKKRSHSATRKLEIANTLISKYQKLSKGNQSKQCAQLALYCLEFLAVLKPVIRGTQFDSLFELKTEVTGKNNTLKYLYFKPWFKEYLKINILNGNLVTAESSPMIEKPLDWKSLRGGGYHTPRMQFKFITRGRNKDYKDADMRKTFNAVNRLQATPLVINKRILEVFNTSIEADLSLGGLPKREMKPKIPFPFGDRRVKDLNPEEFKVFIEWNNIRVQDENERVSLESQYLKMLTVQRECKRFENYNEIYFAYHVDYRGRIYPKANALSPQGQSYIKSLLMFSEGKPIDTRDAEMFLAMHGANTFGEDKLSFEDKYLLILGMHEEILYSAKNPLAHNAIWHEADDPWNFLAFCFEWADYSEQGKNFRSHISIAMDGSCNGLQHLSAMFLDEVGGKSVNLTDNEKKGDIYGDVQELTIKLLLDRNTTIGNTLVEIDAVTRKSCKKPVMTVPYAGTKNGTRETIRDYLVEENLMKHFVGIKDKDVVNEYVNALWDAIEMRIIKGREVMKFMSKSVPKILKASDKKIITWTTPNGFKVIQRKQNIKKERVSTMLGEFAGKARAMVQLQFEGELPDSARHGNCIAPNFIHSLDACHLQNTVLSLPEGLCFNMIHDSYGTHACDSRAMYEAIRQQFYDMYKNNDILQNWIKEQPEYEQPEMPTNGALDLTEVLNSEYFFA